MKIKKILKTILSLAAVSALCLAFTGCSQDISGQDALVGVTQPDEEIGGSISRAYQPIKKADGGKFKMAYVDIDPYNETFRMLYYVVESLKADGWISYDELPFNPETDEDSL